MNLYFHHSSSRTLSAIKTVDIQIGGVDSEGMSLIACSSFSGVLTGSETEKRILTARYKLANWQPCPVRLLWLKTERLSVFSRLKVFALLTRVNKSVNYNLASNDDNQAWAM